MKNEYTKDWKENITSAADPNGLKGGLDNGHFTMEQDIKPYLEQAKKDRDAQELYGKRKQHRKMATIPNIVVLELLTKHGLDLYAQDFHDNPKNLTRLRYLLKTEYRDLLVNT